MWQITSGVFTRHSLFDTRHFSMKPQTCFSELQNFRVGCVLFFLFRFYGLFWCWLFCYLFRCLLWLGKRRGTAKQLAFRRKTTARIANIFQINDLRRAHVSGVSRYRAAKPARNNLFRHHRVTQMPFVFRNKTARPTAINITHNYPPFLSVFFLLRIIQR